MHSQSWNEKAGGIRTEVGANKGRFYLSFRDQNGRGKTYTLNDDLEELLKDIRKKIS